MSNDAGVAIHEEEALGKAYDARLMRRLLRYLRPYRGAVALAVALLLTSAALQLLGPWITSLVLDHAIPQRDLRLLAILTAALLGSILLAFAFEYAQTVLTAWIGQRVMYDLRREIFAHLQRLSLSFFDRNPVGRLMTRVTSDVEVLNELFSTGVVTVFGDVFTLFFIAGAMLLMDWRLALVTLSVMPLVTVVVFVFRARIRDAYREIRVRLARINAFLQERLTGIAVLRVFGREQDAAARFRDIDRDYLDAHLRSIRYYALFFPAMEVLGAIALALIIVYGGSKVLDGSLTIGVVAAFLQYVRRFFQPIQDLSEKYNMLQGAMASSERIFNLLDEQPSIREPAAPLHLPAHGRGEIEFRDVWFAYDAPPSPAVDPEVPSPSPGWQRAEAGAPPPAVHPAGNGAGQGQWVLRGISFRARPGERIAIVGHTGAGKTTLINLLMRFYEPQRGQILFDGVPIDRVPLHELRSRIGLVLQDVFLFSRDIAYNIRLGRDDIDDARIREAAARVGADRFIERLPGGYAETIGERGVTLSVGQRQLLSFARALAFDPLVLVLDEATSSVDSALEGQIQHALDTLMRGRTSIVIAHRLSTVQNADRILVLHRGELREEGTHQELLERGGLYARLHELQFVQHGPAPDPRERRSRAVPAS